MAVEGPVALTLRPSTMLRMVPLPTSFARREKCTVYSAFASASPSTASGEPSAAPVSAPSAGASALAP
jgi:hypothetical protein